MSKQIVFVPQIVMRPDPIAKQLVPVHDFSGAAVYGDLVWVLSATDRPAELVKLTPKIKTALEHFTENDFLVAVGDPSLIALCAGIVLRKNGQIKLLKWDRRFKTYSNMEIVL